MKCGHSENAVVTQQRVISYHVQSHYLTSKVHYCLLCESFVYVCLWGWILLWIKLFKGGPGHLYLLKNKVATFAKVEKEEDMSQWVKSMFVRTITQCQFSRIFFPPSSLCLYVCVSRFWKRLSRFMSKVNPEPNLIHVMGCYVLGNPNGEKVGLMLVFDCRISSDPKERVQARTLTIGEVVVYWCRKAAVTGVKCLYKAVIR